jgi:uncharacterized protein (TIGR00369 family)
VVRKDAGVDDANAQAGLQLLLAIRDGRVPAAPIQAVLDFRLVHVGEGTAAFLYRPSAAHRNPLGTVHGGVAMTLLDSAAGAAVHSTLPAGVGYTTVETKVNLVRGVRTTTGLLRAEGAVVHRGATIATAQSKLTDESGKLYAHATSTCLILNGRDSGASAPPTQVTASSD